MLQLEIQKEPHWRMAALKKRQQDSTQSTEETTTTNKNFNLKLLQAALKWRMWAWISQRDKATNDTLEYLGTDSSPMSQKHKEALFTKIRDICHRYQNDETKGLKMLNNIVQSVEDYLKRTLTNEDKTNGPNRFIT